MSTSGGIISSEPLASGEVGLFFKSENGDAWMFGWIGGHRGPGRSPDVCVLGRGDRSPPPPTLPSLGEEAMLEVRGGHSLFSFVSSLAESPVLWETTLELRGPGDEEGCFFVCCSNRPMRFATLGLGRSSGRCLGCAFRPLKGMDEGGRTGSQKSNSSSHYYGRPSNQRDPGPDYVGQMMALRALGLTGVSAVPLGVFRGCWFCCLAGESGLQVVSLPSSITGLSPPTWRTKSIGLLHATRYRTTTQYRMHFDGGIPCNHSSLGNLHRTVETRILLGISLWSSYNTTRPYPIHDMGTLYPRKKGSDPFHARLARDFGRSVKCGAWTF